MKVKINYPMNKYYGIIGNTFQKIHHYGKIDLKHIMQVFVIKQKSCI